MSKIMTACLRFAPAAALALTLAALGRPAAADPEIVCGPYLRDWSAAVQAKDAGHLHALNAQIAVIAGQCPDLARRARTYVIPRSPNAPPVAQVTRAQPTLTRVKAKAEAPRTRANQLARWGLTDAKWRLTSGDQLVKLVDVGAKQSELRTAANGGDQIAMTLLGFYYYLRQPLGAGDPKASYIWIKKAADRGEPPAIRTLSFFYLFDLGVVSPRDPADGRNLLVRAAKAGDAEAQDRLAYDSLTASEGFPKDQDLGVKMVRLGANQGFAGSQVRLGACYEGGCGPGVKADPVEALKWYMKAADQDNANGQNNAAALYATNFDGSGSRPDLALHYFELSAKQDFVPALLRLGSIYENGFAGVAQNFDTALFWYKKADALSPSPDTKAAIERVEKLRAAKGH